MLYISIFIIYFCHIFTAISNKKNLQIPLIYAIFEGFFIQQGMRESNSHQRFWRPLSYHLTNPLCQRLFKRPLSLIYHSFNILQVKYSGKVFPFELLHGKRMGKIKPLEQIASHGNKSLQLACALHPFRYRFHSERLGHVDHRFHNDPAARSAFHIFKEIHVDLDNRSEEHTSELQSRI